MKKISKRESRERIRAEKELRQIAKRINESISRSKREKTKVYDVPLKRAIEKYGKKGKLKTKGFGKDYKKAIDVYRMLKPIAKSKDLAISNEIKRRLDIAFGKDTMLSYEDIEDFKLSAKSELFNRLKNLGYDSDQVVEMVIESGNKNVSNYLDYYESEIAASGRVFSLREFRKNVAGMRKGTNWAEYI